MDSRKKIEKYVGYPDWMRILAWALVAVAAVALAVGLRSAAKVSARGAAEYYPEDSLEGSQAYVDVVGISEWVYQYDDDTYYTVEDALGYMYTVRMNASLYKKMEPQQTYWNRLSDNEPMPDAYRIYGCVRATTADIRSNMAEAWGISTSEFSLYFGSTFLDTTTSAATEAGIMWYVLAFVTGLSGLLMLLSAGVISSRMKKCLNALEERGLLERAAYQLDSGILQKVGKDRGRLTEQFIFGRGSGMVVRHDEILWAYQRTQRTNFVVTNTYLVVNTRSQQNMNIIALGKNDKNKEIAQAILLSCQHNPDMMVGYTKENIAAYKQMLKV